MERNQDHSESHLKDGGEYPVQESYGLGGEYPAGRRPAPERPSGKPVEIGVQAILLGAEYPTRREVEPHA